MSVNIERADDIKRHVWGSEAYPLERPFPRTYRRQWSKLQSAWDILLKLRNHPGAIVGGLVILTYVVCAVFAPYIAPYRPDQVALTERFVAPSLANAHPLGTDQLGRDILSRVMYGARVSILVGLLTIAISMAVGVGLGLIAGYYQGTFDKVMSRFTDLLLAFPYLIFVIGMMSVLGPGFWNLILALCFKGWVEFYRLARAEVMSQKTCEYVEAARALGRSDWAIMISEILPNIVHSILVLGTLRMGNMIVMESSLSFLGLGVPPRIPAWGSMVSDGRRYMLNAWWVATLPGLALVILVLAINLVGEGLRDVVDPGVQEGQ
jgi:peptide/nickel transport system permease protein